MERRHFLNAIGIVVGAVALAASANAVPLSPISPASGVIDQKHEWQNQGVEPAVVSQDEVDHLKPEEVRWSHHWHRRHWGWHRHWHRHHHWGWRRHWHRHHHWHRRFW